MKIIRPCVTRGLLPLLAILAFSVSSQAQNTSGQSGPTLTGGTICPSGNVISLTLDTTGSELPILPSLGQLTGFTVQARADGNHAWQNQTISGANLTGNVPGLILATSLPATEQVQVIYDGKGKLTDSAFKAVPATTVTLDNKSTWPGESSTKGVMFLGTRGFVRVSADRNNPVGAEWQTLHRQELPYGASAGWKLVYQGLSDGTVDTIQIQGAGVWVQNPGEPRVKVRVTFNGGSQSCSIAPKALQETDPIPFPVLPGAVVWSTQWYRCGLATTHAPTDGCGWAQEDVAGNENYDGCLQAPYGTSEDATITGGFNHIGVVPLTAGVPYYFRGYYPMGLVGQPHPSFTGTEIVPFFMGDSINIQYIDCGSAVKGTYDNMASRGWNGRFCATTYPYVIFGQGGAASDGFIREMGSPTFNYILGSDTSARKVTHAINEYGINSIRLCKPASAVQATEWADRQKIGAIFAKLHIPYIQTTLTPCEQRVTAWTTDNDSFATFVSQRRALNEQIKAESDNAHIPGCIGYIDPNVVLEADPVASSDTWVPAYRTDGIHPNSAGHDAWANTPAVHQQMNDLLVKNPNPIPK